MKIRHLFRIVSYLNLTIFFFVLFSLFYIRPEFSLSFFAIPITALSLYLFSWPSIIKQAIHKALIMIACLGLYLVIYGTFGLVPALFNIVLIFLFLKYFSAEVRYEFEVRNVKVMMWVLTFSIISYLRSDYFAEICLLYVMYIVSSIFLLRILRNYSFGILKKGDFHAGLITAVFLLVNAILLNTSLLWRFYGAIWGLINKFLNAIIHFILDVFGSLISGLFDSVKEKAKMLEPPLGTFESYQKPEEIPPLYMEVDPNIILGIKIVLILILICVVVLIVKSIFKSKPDSFIDEIEIRDAIKIEDAKERKRHYAYHNDIRGKIMKLYYHLLKISSSKGFFKPHMTATEHQASLVNGLNLTQKKEEADGLQFITELYNEAKFSDKSPESCDIHVLKKEYKMIKKRLS